MYKLHFDNFLINEHDDVSYIIALSYWRQPIMQECRARHSS